MKINKTKLRKLVKEFVNDMREDQPVGNIRRAGDFETATQLLYNYVQDNEITLQDFRAAVNMIAVDFE
mgnify:CR=1 FL=1|jgi:hypothetical protein